MTAAGSDGPHAGIVPAHPLTVPPTCKKCGAPATFELAGYDDTDGDVEVWSDAEHLAELAQEFDRAITGSVILWVL